MVPKSETRFTGRETAFVTEVNEISIKLHELELLIGHEMRNLDAVASIAQRLR